MGMQFDEVDGATPAAEEAAVVEEAAPAEAEGAETPAAVEETPEPDIAVDLLADDAPDSMAALDAILEKDGHSSFKVSKEEYDALPISAKQLIHNLRNLSRGKTQTAADERKAAVAAQKAAKAEKTSLEHERAKLYSMFSDPKLAALLKKPEGEVPDPFTEEGVQYRARLAASELMQEFLDQIGAVSDEQLKKIETENAETAHTVKVEAFREWREANPTFEEHKTDVAALLKKVGHTIDYEEAFEIVLARKGVAYKPRAADVRGARRTAQARSTRSKSRDGTIPTAPTKRGTTAKDIQAFYDKNPDAMKADLDDFRRTGTSL